MLVPMGIATRGLGISLFVLIVADENVDRLVMTSWKLKIALVWYSIKNYNPWMRIAVWKLHNNRCIVAPSSWTNIQTNHRDEFQPVLNEHRIHAFYKLVCMVVQLVVFRSQGLEPKRAKPHCSPKMSITPLMRCCKLSIPISDCWKLGLNPGLVEDQMPKMNFGYDTTRVITAFVQRDNMNSLLDLQQPITPVCLVLGTKPISRPLIWNCNLGFNL